MGGGRGVGWGGGGRDSTDLVAGHGGDHVVVRLPDTSSLKDLTPLATYASARPFT